MAIDAAPVRIDVHETADGAIVELSLCRPETRNALDEEMVDALHGVLAEWRDQPSILVLRSDTPGMFVSGADVRELIDRDRQDALRRINVRLFEAVAGHRWPTIAAVGGHALGGGCELALACDFRVVGPSAVFGQPEADLGILAGAGANWRLERLVGLGVARRVLLAGDWIDADQAMAVGLADRRAETAEDLDDTARQLADRVARRSWAAMEFTKAAIAQNNRPTVGLDVAAQAVLFDTDDKRRRMQEFLDRRR